jgi:erythronate-4-phosphate dehydrogenase
MKILADASLPGLLAAFPAPFQLSLYQRPLELPDLLAGQDVLLCRSTLPVNKALLGGHSLHAVATASSGIDHIDKDYLDRQGILCLDAKGSNAPSVADYVLATLAYLDSQGLIKGKQVGILGLGHVGEAVAKRLAAVPFPLHCYDPLRALRDPSFHSVPLERLFSCDILCIHADLHTKAPYPSQNLINSEFLDQLKPHCIIINAARGGIVNESDLIAHSKPLIYCTDVYSNEPTINAAVLAKATLCTPHIAGHSLEAKYAAIAYLSTKLHRLLNLPLPNFAKPPPPPAESCPRDLDPMLNLILGKQGEYSSSQNQSCWQEVILSLYNPGLETKALQETSDKKATFLALRQQHQQRHDFATYLVGV